MNLKEKKAALTAYQHGKNMTNIASYHGITRSRISQIIGTLTNLFIEIQRTKNIYFQRFKDDKRKDLERDRDYAEKIDSIKYL